MNRDRGISRMDRDVRRNARRTGIAAPAVAINERKVRPGD